MNFALMKIIDNNITNKLIYLILIISLVVNVIAAFTFYPGSPKSGSDAVGYNKIGLNIASGKGFSLDGETPTSFREPVYPFFIAIIYFIFGYNLIAVKLVQALIGVAIVFLVFKIGKRLFERRIALVAAFLTSVWIPLMRYCGSLTTEILFTLLLMVSVYCLLKLKDRPTIRMAALCGLIIGLGALTRVTLLLIPLFVLFWMLISFPMKKTQVIYIWGVLFICMIVPVSLWIVRCYIAEGQFVLLTTHVDKILYYQTNDTEKVLLFHKKKALEAENQNVIGKEDGRDNEEWKKQKRKWNIPVLVFIPKILSKERFPVLYVNFRAFWTPLTRRFIKHNVPYYILHVAILVMYAFALNGMIRTFLPRNFDSGSALISLFVIHLVVMHTLTHGRLRYRRPIMPFVILLTSYAFFIVSDYVWNKVVRHARLDRKRGVSVEEEYAKF